MAASIAAASLTGAWTLIDKFEGNVPVVYKDPLGIKTICRGTTSGPLIVKGKASAAECDAATLHDIKVAAATVDSCYKGPMTVGERNAWVSFTFNVGPGGKGVKDGFCRLKSGAVPGHIKLLIAGKPREACAKLFEWTMPGTNVHNGLLNRRTNEFKVCVRDLP